MFVGSPQHEELQRRVAALGRLRTTAVDGRCLSVQFLFQPHSGWSLSIITPVLQKPSAHISLALGKPLQDGVLPLFFLP